MADTEHDNQDAEPVEEIEPDDGDGDGEPDGEEPQAPASSGPSTEAQLKKADAAHRAYMRKLDQILGADELRHECAACNGLGVQWGEPEAAPELVAAEDAEPCPKCNAFGLTLTGSKQPGQETKPCGGCGGRGWREKVVPLAAVAPYVPSEQVAPQVLSGQWIPGKGFVPYGSDEALPNTAGLV